MFLSSFSVCLMTVMEQIDQNKDTAEQQIELLVSLQKVVDTQNEEFFKKAPSTLWFPLTGESQFPGTFQYTKQQKYRGFEK